MKKEKLSALVSSAQQGDHTALSELFNAFYNDVYYFALKILKDEDLACDITQETFIEIINTIGSLKEPAAFITWMKQITYHQCTRYFKKKKDVLVDEDEDGHSVFDTIKEDRSEFIPDEALDQEDFRKTILAMIDTLSEEQRATILLYYYDELTTKSIAEIMGISEGTVKSRLIYARKVIKRSVEDYEKKTGVRLHSVAMFPLIAWLFAGAGETLPTGALPVVVGGITTATGTTIAVSSASAAAATATTAAAATGTGLLAKLAGIPIAAKIIAGIAAVTVVVGSIVPTLLPDDAPTEPTIALQTEAATSTVPVTVPPTTQLPVTEPPVTEPTVTVIPVSEAGGIIEEGCTYVMADGTVLSAGEAMPMTIADGDEYISEDYIYKHGYSYDADEDSWNTASTGGWSVIAANRAKTTYPELLPRINGASVTDMTYTFYDCRQMEESPSIPESVTGLYGTFYECTSLLVAPAIPDGVTDMGYTFAGCTALKEGPQLPDGVVDIRAIFTGCSALQTVSEIPSTVTNMRWAFANCYKLKKAPDIPNGAVDIAYAFIYCSVISKAPVIPAGVKDMTGTFRGCDSLTGIIGIHATPTKLKECFADTVCSIALFGTGANLNALAATATGSNVIAPQTSGTWAEGFSWNYDWETTTLHVSGEGSLPETIPNAVATLRPYIQTLKIGSGLTTVCLNPFGSYGNLETVYVSETIRYFDGLSEYFACIPSLQRFVVDENSTVYCNDENGVLYNKDMTVLERVPCGWTGDFTVLDSVVRMQPAYSVYNCGKLTNLYIGPNVSDLKDWGNWDYFFCKSLQGIWVDSDNPNYCNDEYGALYTKDKTTFLRLPMTYQGEYILPEGVDRIEACAFDGCAQLTNVQIPEGVTFIGEYAFYDCDALTQLTFPSTMAQLGGWRIFSGCDNLSEFCFLGSATWLQTFNNSGAMFGNFKGTVYYPGEDETWTDDILASHPDITWIPY